VVKKRESKELSTRARIASLKQAARNNNAEALEGLGMFCRDGYCNKNGRVLVRKDLRAAKEYFGRAAELGKTYSMVAFADQLSLPGSRARSFRDATTWYRRAFRLGEAVGAHNLAVMYQNQGRLRLAVRWFRRAGQVEYSSAALPLALAELNGSGTRRNAASAVRGLTRVAGGRIPVSQLEQEEAMLALALAYLQGWLLRRNYKVAVCWLRKASELGSAAAYGLLRDLSEEPRQKR
jgi:TPR repeat protein